MFVGCCKYQNFLSTRQFPNNNPPHSLLTFLRTNERLFYFWLHRKNKRLFLLLFLYIRINYHLSSPGPCLGSINLLNPWCSYDHINLRICHSCTKFENYHYFSEIRPNSIHLFFPL